MNFNVGTVLDSKHTAILHIDRTFNQQRRFAFRFCGLFNCERTLSNCKVIANCIRLIYNRCVRCHRNSRRYVFIRHIHREPVPAVEPVLADQSGPYYLRYRWPDNVPIDSGFSRIVIDIMVPLEFDEAQCAVNRIQLDAFRKQRITHNIKVVSDCWRTTMVERNVRYLVFHLFDIDCQINKRIDFHIVVGLEWIFVVVTCVHIRPNTIRQVLFIVNYRTILNNETCRGKILNLIVFCRQLGFVINGYHCSVGVVLACAPCNHSVCRLRTDHSQCSFDIQSRITVEVVKLKCSAIIDV